MADTPSTPTEPVPAVTTPQAVDPFDLGNTEMDLTTPEPAKPLPPRGPDGKFLPTTPEPTPPAAVPAKPAHPTYLIRQATDLGIPEADMAEMHTEALGLLVWRMNRQREQFRQEQLKARTMSDAQVKTPEPTPAPPPEEAIDLGLEDESMYDPKLLEAIRRTGRASAAKIKELQTELEATKQREAQRDAARASDLIDAAFAKLGADYEKLFGKGAASAMGEAQKVEYGRRITALQAAGITNLGQVDRATIFGKLKAAVETTWPTTPAVAQPYGELGNPAPAPPAPRITPEQWNEAGLARPTHRADAPEPNGDAKAVHNLEKKFRETGMGEVDSEIMDGLLPG